MTAVGKPIFAAILAAGKSSRFGSTKQLAEVNGMTLVQKAAATASQVCGNRVVVIAGADWQNVTRSVAGECRFFAFNEAFAQGMGTSIALAARLVERRAAAMLLTLADQPLISAAHLKALIDAWSGDENEIVASAYAGTLGPPVLFPGRAFPVLSGLTGDAGARALFRNPRFRTVSVACDDAAIDIDTVADLNAV